MIIDGIKGWTADNTKSRIHAILEVGTKTQAELAFSLGVSAATVNRWLNGHYMPDFRSRRALMALEESLKTRARATDAE